MIFFYGIKKKVKKNGREDRKDTIQEALTINWYEEFVDNIYIYAYRCDGYERLR